MKTYLTKNEVAEVLRVTPRTVTTYVRQGALPVPVRLGRRPLWAQDDLERAIQASRHPQAAAEPFAPAPRRRGRPRKIWV
jgi:predicted site-specific integrase-resolvase